MIKISYIASILKAGLLLSPSTLIITGVGHAHSSVLWVTASWVAVPRLDTQEAHREVDERPS